MNVGDLVALVNGRSTVQLINHGHNPPECGDVTSNEVCVVLELIPPNFSIWGKIRVLGRRGNIGWADDGLFYVVSSKSS